MSKLLLACLLLGLIGCSQHREERTTDSVAVPSDSSVLHDGSVTIPPLPGDTMNPGILGDTTLSGSAGDGSAPIVNGPKLFPIDEGSRDASFAAFREKLLAVVGAHDEAGLMKLIATPLQYSFGVNEGLSGFRKHWKLDKNSTESDLWPALDFVLRHGGKFDKGGYFWAPYFYIAWPESPNLDAFRYAAVTNTHVPMYALPSRKSDVVSALNYDIVRYLAPRSNDKYPPHSPNLWRQVATADSVHGYVSDDHLGSPIGYRAAFKKINSEWKMTTLVAGD